MGHPPQAVWLPGPGLAHLAPAVERTRAYHGTTPEEFAVVLRARPRGTEAGQLAAIAWVLDAARGHVLLVDHRQHGWSCPGGHVETREEPAAAAARALSEETGLRLTPDRLDPVTVSRASSAADDHGPAHDHAELARRVQTDPDTIADLDLVIEELDRLGTLSSRLLTLAAVNGATLLATQDIDVDELIVALGRRWVPTATRRWQFESSAAGTIRADPERVAAALDALIENAVKFTDETDDIEVRAEPAGDVRFVVADTGAGISPDLVPRVFDAFARADFGRDKHTGGTGLGLAIVKAIAEAHGGTVEVTSERGVGSTFVMCLPRRGPTVGSTMLLSEPEFGPDGDSVHSQLL